MPAKLQFPSSMIRLFKASGGAARWTRKAVWVVALTTVLGFAAWANTAWAATTSPTTTSALAPALKLAAGTINLEGTDQAVDSASAAKLLPLWKLLEQLDTSGSAAPEEITAVVQEIELTMTSAQIKAIDAMSITESQVAPSGGAAPSASNANTRTGTQVVSASADPALGGMPSDGAPLDGGGPMPSGGSQTTSSASKTSSTSSAPAVIKQVIQLLETKTQS